MSVIAFDRDELASFRLDEVVRLLSRKLDQALAGFGLTRAQWRLLAFVSRYEGVTQSELARLMDFERATVGQAIDAMERKGLVQRTPAPEDRRVWRIVPTEAALALSPALRPVVDALMAQMFRDFSDADRGLLDGLLARLSANLENETLAVPQENAA